MSDNLRTRIAAAIDATYMSSADRVYQDWLNSAADAVIEALGLKHYCRDCGGWGTFDE